MIHPGVAPLHEYDDLPQTAPAIRSVGWTLGHHCPYGCAHCYSQSARVGGRELTRAMVDRVVERLVDARIGSVNLGGNEPLYAGGNGADGELLVYAIRALAAAGIPVGLTTNGTTLLALHQRHRDAFAALNDVDVSLDSPFAVEHDRSRGAPLYAVAIEALERCATADLPRAVAYCAMAWNFDRARLDALVELCLVKGAKLRVNAFKTVRADQLGLALEPRVYFAGFAHLLSRCDTVDLGEPPLAAVAGGAEPRRCPCGRTSLRIHAPTAAGAIFASPCVYLHDLRVPIDLMEHDLAEIVASPQFRVLRQRHRNPERVEGCAGCALLAVCGGGCAARAYLETLHREGRASLLARDPCCPREHAPPGSFPRSVRAPGEAGGVHVDYLCTWIGRPRPTGGAGA